MLLSFLTSLVGGGVGLEEGALVGLEVVDYDKIMDGLMCYINAQIGVDKTYFSAIPYLISWRYSWVGGR